MASKPSYTSSSFEYGLDELFFNKRMGYDKFEPSRTVSIKLRPITNAARSETDTRFGIHSVWSHRLSFAVLLALISVYVLFLLSNGTFQLFAPELFSPAYGNMLMHMLHGEFTVDQEVIGYEAFPRDGKAYSYFGIFSSLLRLIALPFTDVTRVDMARLSCLTARHRFPCPATAYAADRP